MTKTIGIIGLGSIGMRHAKNLIAMGHSIWAFDPDKDKITSIAKSKELNLALDIKSLLELPLEAIVIASPTSEHYQQLLLVADYDKPIFVEKPVSDSEFGIPDFGQLITMVGYNLRFHSCVKKAKEWIDNGRIGKPLWAQFTLGQFSDKPPYLRDGVILNWSHELDLALYLLGHAQLAGSSTRLTDGKDDISDILLTHDSDCRSTVHLDYVTKPEIREFIICGSDGLIKADLARRVIWSSFGGYHDGHDTRDDNYIEEMRAFIDRCDGKETIGCTGQEALEVLKICLEVRKQAGLS